MLLIFLEALLALVLFLLLIWWTMFSGRKRGELDVGQKQAEDVQSPQEDRH